MAEVVGGLLDPEVGLLVNVDTVVESADVSVVDGCNVVAAEEVADDDTDVAADTEAETVAEDETLA